jgi:hypothetical protein
MLLVPLRLVSYLTSGKKQIESSYQVTSGVKSSLAIQIVLNAAMASAGLSGLSSYFSS